MTYYLHLVLNYATMKLFFLLWILPLTLGDTHVSCIYSEECMLPCTSTKLDIIHWYKDKIPVHSFYHNQNQLGHQHPDYKGRTSLLSESEIKNGNLSLFIINITVQDEGKYKCYAATDKTNDENYVDVSVEAPAKSVNITLNNDKVICSTSGVYPKPKVLWWSSDLPAMEPQNSLSQTEDQLFTVTSQLQVDAITDTYTYNCSITTNKHSYTASLTQQAAELSENEFTFKCPVTKDFNYSLTLSFSTTTVLTYDHKTSMKEISKQWGDKVTFHPENGSINLSHLNQEQLGTYTCESTTAQYRYITQTTVQSEGLGKEVYIIVICISIVLAILLIALIVYVVRKRYKERLNVDRKYIGHEMEDVNKPLKAVKKRKCGSSLQAHSHMEMD